MPRVELFNPRGEGRPTKGFPAPKTPLCESSWITAARKVLPEIPNPRETDWQIGSFEPGPRYIAIQMFNGMGERVYVTIDRWYDHVSQSVREPKNSQSSVHKRA